MKTFFVLFFTLNCLLSFSQSINLGTTYFRNDQYLISFDKVLYPGYNLKIENLKKREYLMGQLVSDTLYQEKFEIQQELSDNNYTYYLALSGGSISNNSIFPCLEIGNNECFYIEGTLTISGSKVSDEKYEIPDNFEFYTSSSAPIKRMNKEATKVEVVSIESTIDFQTNQMVQSETVLETRNLSSKEVADSEGNIYLTTTIGDQTWMAENLRSTKFNNGVEIPQLTEAQWANSTAPGIVSVNPGGTFYNFFTLSSENNVCPQGFHVPDNHDIAELYNKITPYDDHLKVSGSIVKIKVYAPALAPIVIPVLSAVHLGLWGGIAAFDAGLISIAAISDLALFSSELAISPVFGWRSKKSQNKANLKMAKKYTYINVKGIPVSYDSEENDYSLTNLNPINKSDWSKFKIVDTKASLIDDSEGTIIIDQKSIDSLQKNHTDYTYKLKFKPFCIPGTNTFWSSTAWLFENFEGGGFGSFNIMPYKFISDKDYPANNYRCSLGKFGHQPVLTLLLNKGDNEFADQYGFNLNFDNTISFAKNVKSKSLTRTGISYLDGFGLPGFFGINDKSNDHELNLLENLWSDKINEADLMRIQTRVRCVKD
jgi:hypothetical protein